MSDLSEDQVVAGAQTANVAGVLAFLGGSAVLSWEGMSISPWIGIPAFFAVVLAMSLPMMMMHVRSEAVRALGALLFAGMTLMDVGIAGYSIRGIPVLSHAPGWPAWLGLILLGLAAIAAFAAISLVTIEDL